MAAAAAVAEVIVQGMVARTRALSRGRFQVRAMGAFCRPLIRKKMNAPRLMSLTFSSLSSSSSLSLLFYFFLFFFFFFLSS
jgi:hypothetical protein